MPARLAIAQINPTVGDLVGNCGLITEWAAKAHKLGGQVILFPQGALTGHPLESLAHNPAFQRAANQQLTKLTQTLQQQGMGGAHIVVGALGTTNQGQPTNTAAVLHQGKVQYLHASFRFQGESVPAADHQAAIFQSHGSSFGLAIGDELSPPPGAASQLANQSLDALLVLGGSPFAPNEMQRLHQAAAAQASQLQAPVAFGNLIGGQDDLVFPGGSFVMAPNNSLVSQAGQFHQELIFWHAGDLSAKPTLPMPETEAIYHAITLGLADYAKKNGFSKAIVGLSGGIDSALVAALAADALGPKNVLAVAMPSQHSSPNSLDDAADQAKRLGLGFRSVPIQDMVDQFQARLDLTGVAAENIQARVRGMVLMAISNLEGHLVLATGNKSELAVGYSTIYGDAVGGYAPIKDVLKTQVWELARWRNAFANERGEPEPIPEAVIVKPPSAELRPNQLDSDTLPDYEVLDPVLAQRLDQGASRSALLAAGHDPKVVDLALRSIDQAEWKRRQYPLGPRVSFGPLEGDRRRPITNRWQELQP
ncbi:MAG: NAD+ synthase [Micrococcales bacterium]|nr:NAD+ synthase [Micrococcales bacterium]